MSVAEEYKQQHKWRSWDNVYDSIPEISGKKILDLGCAIGDQSSDLSKKGGIVTGVDFNKDFIDHATSRQIQNANFCVAHLDNLSSLSLQDFDIIWSSFSLAYFPHQKDILEYWSKFLNRNGIFVLVEISGLLDFTPLPEELKIKIKKFYQDAFENNRYDFLSGEKIGNTLRDLGFNIIKEMDLQDKELTFDKIDDPEILTAWENRFHRMGAFRKFMGQDSIDYIIDQMRKGMLRSTCKVKCIIAERKMPRG